MPRSRSPRIPPTRVSIPPELAVSATTLDALRRSGLLDRATKAVGLSRRHGYGGGPVLAFFVAMLLMGAVGSIIGFTRRYRGPVMQALAALAGFRSLPTASSLSRCLGAVTVENAHAFADEMLCGDPRARALLRRSAVHHRDGHGRGWHVVDLDPTITAYRQRGLPEGDDLPEPKRLAPGKPGYTGHHRGEVRTRLVPVRHAGAGLWLGCRLIEGAESALGAVRELARTTRSALLKIDGLTPMVMRMDGEFGSVGALRACIEADAVPLARLSRYGILDATSVTAHLAAGTWSDVPDSGSGPRRMALDLGFLTLHPSDEAEGASDGPIEARVVVTRYAQPNPGNHGAWRDGYVYELIVTTLTADAWPPEHVAALFFGRAAMENAFAQEDREFGTDRTFSYNAPGQAWVTMIAQFLSNTLVLDAVDAHPLPANPPAQAPRPLPNTEPTPPVVDDEPPPEPMESPVSAEVAESVEGTGSVEAADSPEPSGGTDTPSKVQARATLWGVVEDLFADIDGKKGWTLDRVEQTVRCPTGRIAVASGFGQAREHKRPTLFLRVSAEHCRECPTRLACIRSADPTKGKRIGRSIDLGWIDRIQPAIDVLHQPDALRPLPGRDYQVKATPRPDLPPGPWTPAAPLFLPAAARRLAREAATRRPLVCLLLPAGVRRPRRHPLLAGAAAERQHRRLSWAERRERWQSPYNATLSGARQR